MQKKIKNKKLNKILGLILGVFICFFIFTLTNSIVNSADEEVVEEIENLEDKADDYRKMIELKQKQQNTLKNQLEIMELNEIKIEKNVKSTKNEIRNKENEVNELKNNISETEKEIEKTKEGMAEMLRTYYKLEKEVSLSILSSKGSLSDIFNHSEYLNQASQEVEKVLGNIKVKKEELGQEQAEVEDKKAGLEDNEKELEDELLNLANEQKSKSFLLGKTKGEESKYQELLVRVEQQKKELIGGVDSFSSEIKGELSSIKANAKKPKEKYRASTKWYYAQDDNRWAQTRIGISSSLMKDYGCAISAVAMVFTYHDEDITPGSLAKKPIFYRDLIEWPLSWGNVSLSSSKYHGNVNWSTIDKEIKKNNPVIVFVRATSGGAGHYVVIHGKDSNDYIVHDPLFGSNIYLGTTKKLVGSIYGSSTTINQMIIYKD